jgi:hypothetical protein
MMSAHLYKRLVKGGVVFSNQFLGKKGGSEAEQRPTSVFVDDNVGDDDDQDGCSVAPLLHATILIYGRDATR